MLNGRLVKRKWGWYWTILSRKHFKVKLLRFKSAGKLSLQYHNHRNELWLFLSGKGSMKTAKVKGMFDIKSGDYYLAATGDLHKYIAITPTWVLEIQYGERCEESDIVRL